MTSTSQKIIGRGTWLDMIAHRVIQREQSLGRSSETLRTESGLGASGIPHIGTFSDVIRAYGIKLALESQGFRSEFIAFSDDLDGLRKVPQGMPSSLAKYLAHPVSAIPDPYGCHESYAAHVNSLLLDAIQKSGVEATFLSATEVYRRGILLDQIRKLLLSAEKVGRIVREEVGQEKYTALLPYFPICASCGKIYTTQALRYEKETDKVLYACQGEAGIKGERIRGCNYKGEIDIKEGKGKLPWKAEFAARWTALKINFEAYGKDIADSVRVNDRICEEILGFPHPYHARYELFLDKGGKKISKSKSAVGIPTPSSWFMYADPRTLNLLMFKRIIGTRAISLEDIPTYVDEFNCLEDIYFGIRYIEDEKEKAKLKGLYEYACLLKPPPKPSIHIPYNLLVYLVKVAPPQTRLEYVTQKLQEYGIIKRDQKPDIQEHVEHALNWSKDFSEVTPRKIDLSPQEKKAIADLTEIVRSVTDEKALQNSIFETAKKNGITPHLFFKTLYQILLGSEHGPRLGPYIKSMGAENVAGALETAISSATETA